MISVSDGIQLFLLVVTIVSVILAILSNRKQVKNFNEQLKLGFFAEYTRRYQEIILNLPEEVHEDKLKFDTLEKTEKDNVLKYMRVYFDLCSEEFHLHKYSQIDCIIWKNWEHGIKHSFSLKVYQDAWEIVNRTSMFDGTFADWINEIIMQNTHLINQPNSDIEA